MVIAVDITTTVQQFISDLVLGFANQLSICDNHWQLQTRPVSRGDALAEHAKQ
jgi:hypothetical protein